MILLVAVWQMGNAQKMLMFKEAVIPYPKSVNNIVADWNNHQGSFNKLSHPEREFYYWVNYSRLNPKLFFDSVVRPIVTIYPQLKGDNLESLEKDIAKMQSLPLLTLNGSLTQMAKTHAIDIVSHEATPSHNSTNGQTFSERFKAHKFQKCGGENVSFGGNDPIFLLVLLYLDINVPELGHRKALLNSAYTETGIGAAFYKNGNIFIVEDFSCVQN